MFDMWSQYIAKKADTTTTTEYQHNQSWFLGLNLAFTTGFWRVGPVDAA
jgi:hypothetical protein